METKYRKLLMGMCARAQRPAAGMEGLVSAPCRAASVTLRLCLCLTRTPPPNPQSARSGGALVIVAYVATMGFLRIKMPSYMHFQSDGW